MTAIDFWFYGIEVDIIRHRVWSGHHQAPRCQRLRTRLFDENHDKTTLQFPFTLIHFIITQNYTTKYILQYLYTTKYQRYPTSVNWYKTGKSLVRILRKLREQTILLINYIENLPEGISIGTYGSHSLALIMRVFTKLWWTCIKETCDVLVRTTDWSVMCIYNKECTAFHIFVIFTTERTHMLSTEEVNWLFKSCFCPRCLFVYMTKKFM